MLLRMPLHRVVVAAVHTMIVLTMLALFIGQNTFENSNPVFLMLLLLIPASVIVWSIVDIERKARILGYWGLAALMVPLAGLGIFGGYGLLYLIGIIFLLWAAWSENEGKR